MNQVSSYLRKTATGYYHWCPGCHSAHHYITDGSRGWTFNGDVNKPTFKPSMRLSTPAYEDDGVKYSERTLCHYFLTEGRIQFLADCDHELKGQTVPLPPLPSEADYSYGD